MGTLAVTYCHYGSSSILIQSHGRTRHWVSASSRTFISLLVNHNLFGHLVDSLGQSADVLRGDSGNGDSAVLGSVDGELLGKSLNLLRRQTGVAEHTNLRGDVVPVLLGAKSLEVLLEQSSHLDHSVGHLLDLTEPLLLELGVVEDGGGDSGTVDGGVGVEGSDDNLQLRVNSVLLGGVLADKRESTDSLTVKTHVLGEGLAQSNLVALLDKVSDGVGVSVDVTGGKALVGHVEEGEVALGLDDLLNLSPLLGSGVNTGGVVGTGVQKDGGSVGGSLQVGEQTLKVEGNVLGVVVPVGGGLEAGGGENGLVVSPRRLGEQNLLGGVELVEELGSDSQSTGTGDGLGDGNSVLEDGGGVGAVSELGSSLGEGGDSGDGGVLLVEGLVHHLLLGLSDGGKNEGLSAVISVGANTEVDLLLKGVLLERLGDSENGVGGTLGDLGPDGLESHKRGGGGGRKSGGSHDLGGGHSVGSGDGSEHRFESLVEL